VSSIASASWMRSSRRGRPSLKFAAAKAVTETPVAAPEPPNRENRQRFPVLLFARLPLGTVGRWVDRSWRPGPRRVPRCDPGGTAALGATWGGGAYRTPSPWWRGSGVTAEPGPRSRFWAVPRTRARASVPVLGPGSDDRAEAGYQCSHDDAERADLKTRALLAWSSGAAGLPARPCSQIAHRRCAYSWTSQHTSVARMQVRRTTLDTSVRRGTGWSGSNPDTLTSPRQANQRRLHPGAM
jgi:hypothetical protein